MTTPAISVIMPVYNAEPYISEAIESILNQSFNDFEFLIIDDASTDKSVEIIKSFRDNRIVLIQKPINSGIVDSLNIGIKLSKGKYIARMDADDISLPNRFLIQYNYMEQHPDIMVLGAMYKIIDTEIISKKLPITYEQVKIFSLADSPVAHPTVFIRRSIFDTYNLRYNVSFEYAEDYDLWTRILEIGKIENLPDVLLHYRNHEKQITQIKNSKLVEAANKVRLRQLSILIDFKNKKYDSDFAVKAISRQLWNITAEELLKINYLLSDIFISNKTKKIYDQVILLNFLNDLWNHYVFNLSKYSIKYLIPLLSDPLKIKSYEFSSKLIFIIKSFLSWKTKTIP